MHNTEVVFFLHKLKRKYFLHSDEEPEEDLTVEQIETKAQSGDATAQTQASENVFKLGIVSSPAG